MLRKISALVRDMAILLKEVFSDMDNFIEQSNQALIRVRYYRSGKFKDSIFGAGSHISQVGSFPDGH